MPQPRLDSGSRVWPGAALVAVDGCIYPLRSAAIIARAEGGLALTTLAQEFHNPHLEPLEVRYTLPLPADGAVVGYAIRIGERVIRGEVERRQAAEKAFVEALAEGREAGLLEQDRDDTFTQRLGSIPPGQDVRVEIDVLHLLDFVPSQGEDRPLWEYRFPTVVGVRYQGAPGRVEDAERLDVHRAGEGEIPTRINLDLTLADGPPAALAVVSTTHDIACSEKEGLSRVSLRAGARLDRDLVVAWNACAERSGVRLVEGPGLAGDDGRYGLMTLTPPAITTSALPRDLTVLLDASGSMDGDPLEVAKQVVTDLIASLEPDDRFEVIAFSNDSRSLTGGLKKATCEHRAQALRSLASLPAGGATEMAHAVIEAIQPLRDDSQRQVVLVTDGHIGFEAQVTGEILRRLPGNARVHTVGVGSAPNRSLTRSVARAGRGVEVFAGDGASAASAARRLCRATVRPVLTELTVRGNGLRRYAPQRPRDVLAGQPIVLALELEPNGGTVEVAGREAGSAEAWIWRLVVPARAGVPAGGMPVSPDAAALTATSLPIGALYGGEIISDLELDKALGETGADVDRRIEENALRHRIASRMTSLVAIAEEPSVDPKLPRRRERLAVEVPAGVSPAASLLLMGPRAGLLGSGAMGLVYKLASAGRPPYVASEMIGAIRSAMPTRPGSRAGMSSEPDPRQVPIASGRLLRAAPDTVTVEFETPFDGFVLPDGEINLWLDGKRWLVARVLPEDTSPRGPHRAGLVVRLALSIDQHPEWLGAGSFDLRWLSRPEGGASNRTPRQIILSVAVVPQAAGPR
jgi:Ca-activated chloride channel homolog